MKRSDLRYLNVKWYVDETRQMQYHKNKAKNMLMQMLNGNTTGPVCVRGFGLQKSFSHEILFVSLERH